MCWRYFIRTIQRRLFWLLTQETNLLATMTVTAANILTAETVPAYLQGHADKLQGIFSTKDSKLKLNATAIQGGNVNYAFCVAEQALSRRVFLKQAPEFVAIFGPDGFPLTSERMQQEMDVYDEWKTLLGEELAKKYLPTIHFFDSTLAPVML